MAFATLRTFARVSALRRPFALSALEAVPMDTPASRATSRMVCLSRVFMPPSSLDSARHEAAHEMALKKQKQDQARQRHHDHAGFGCAIVDRPHRLLAEVGDCERKGLLRRVVEQDERGEEIVPRRKESEQADRDETGAH